METFNKICVVLLIVGGLNWGLIGLFDFNLVGWLFGGMMTLISRLVYILVGVAAICAVPGLFSTAMTRENRQ